MKRFTFLDTTGNNTTLQPYKKRTARYDTVTWLQQRHSALLVESPNKSSLPRASLLASIKCSLQSFEHWDDVAFCSFELFTSLSQNDNFFTGRGQQLVQCQQAGLQIFLLLNWFVEFPIITADGGNAKRFFDKF